MVRGSQEPRIWSVPPADRSLFKDVVQLARWAGMPPDPWQRFVLEHALAVKKNGRWAAFEVGLNVARQNGKGSILEMRQLAGLEIFEERLQIHSAHNFDTSKEHFWRLVHAAEEAELPIKKVLQSSGEESIEMRNGCRIRFRTRTKGGGRGFTCDTLYLDEAMFIPEFTHGALLPILSARPNSQVWYAGSAVDQMVEDDGIVFARVRERGRKGGDKSLAWFEWSAPIDDTNPEHLSEEQLGDLAGWQAANPGLGIRITRAHIAHELRSMDGRTFAVERLGVGDWPPTDKSALTVIPMAVWNSLVDVHSSMEDPVTFAFDISPSRSSAAIGAAGLRPDGVPHIEVVDHRKGTGWLVDRIEELWFKHHAAAVVCDGKSPAAALLEELERRDVPVLVTDSGEHANACATIFDLCDQGWLRHLGTAELRTALKGAKQRPLGDAWAWARGKSTVDITPLVAVTLALWASVNQERPVSGDLLVL